MITSDLNQVKTALINGDIIALPTETVYGLAANIYLDSALEKVFKLKKRPSYNPLIVHISNAGILEQIAKNIPAKARELANVFWPGPLTLVLEKQDQIPNRITAGKPTVAVRVPNHPIALQLLKSLNFPLAAPSANPFGSLSPTSAEHVALYFKEEIKKIRDRSIILIGFSGGFRRNEIVSLDVDDLDFVIEGLKIKVKRDAIQYYVPPARV